MGGEKMKYIPDNYGERCRFDAFCKTVLRNEARTYLRDLSRQRKRETEFSALSQHEMDKLCTMDEYPSDSVVFTAFGCDLHIRDELVADAFASLPEQEQGILILYCALELTDGEIGGIAGMSRSAVQRHRTKTLNELQKDLQSKEVRR
ncbi:MAG: sigma-70 family RNA polymerase sigma factor [Peptoniphilaceae bacterium]|nr:sigma-70 family RNA polymerase sigma factor [Peptoniphilaceae bacterium]MDY6147323.1 sigma-70 family RNA polymerase sigma factor [Peptoniphilaceae bacterium]